MMDDGTFPSPKYTISILKEGYRRELEQGLVEASGSVTLLLGRHNVLVGTGGPGDRDLIVRGLGAHNVSPEAIEYVICTHGHLENVGNLNLFPHATHIVGHDIMKAEKYVRHHFNQGIPFEIDEDLEVVTSPGLSPSAVAVIVTNSNLGTVAIAGSTFHSEADLEDPDLWMEDSMDPETQQQSRIDILRDAMNIIPRYGNMFRVPDSYKGEMKVVMTP